MEFKIPLLVSTYSTKWTQSQNYRWAIKSVSKQFYISTYIYIYIDTPTLSQSGSNTIKLCIRCVLNYQYLSNTYVLMILIPLAVYLQKPLKRRTVNIIWTKYLIATAAYLQRFSMSNSIVLKVPMQASCSYNVSDLHILFYGTGKLIYNT